MRRLCSPLFEKSLRKLVETIVASHAVETPITFIGTGKSFYLATRFARTLNSLGIAAQSTFLNELCHGDMGMIPKKGSVVLISKSGNESKNDLFRKLKMTRNISLFIMVANDKFTNHKPDNLVDHVLNIGSIREVGRLDVIPSFSLSATILEFDCVLADVPQQLPELEKDFLSNHPSGIHGELLNLKLREISVRAESLAVCSPSEELGIVLRRSSRAQFGVFLLQRGTS